MKLTKNQLEALYTVGTQTRTNIAELGRAGMSLMKCDLVEKDWHKNDASGERLVLTEAGREAFKKNFG